MDKIIHAKSQAIHPTNPYSSQSNTTPIPSQYTPYAELQMSGTDLF